MKRLLMAMLVAVALTGCATGYQKAVRDDVAATETTAHAHTETMRRMDEGYWREVDADWLGGDAIPLTKTIEEAPVLRLPAEYQVADPSTLQEVAEYITRKLGVPVTVTTDAGENAAKVVPATVENAAGAIKVRYTEGTLRGLLDYVTSRTGTFWSLDGGRITIAFRDTRSFTIAAIPTSSEISGTMTNSTGAGGGAGGGEGGGGQGSGGDTGGGGGATKTSAAAGQTSTVKASLEIFDSVTKAVETMLSEGGKVTATPAANSITVTDVPVVLARVERYVDELNERIKRQVSFEVRVYSLDQTSGQNYGINWSLVREQLGSTLLETMSFSDAPNNVNSAALTVIDPGSDWNGTSLLVEALETQGDVAIESSANVVTLTNSAAPIFITEEVDYIERVEALQTANVGSQITVTPGKVITGFVMTLLPTILDDQEILLQFQLGLSTLRDLRAIDLSFGQIVGPGSGLRIETPSVDGRSTQQEVRLQSGQTLVLSGFEQSRAQSNSRGIGSADFTLAGGGANSDRRKLALVVTITPKVF